MSSTTAHANTTAHAIQGTNKASDLPEAEEQCQYYLKEALSKGPTVPEVHMTFSSLLLSQNQPEAAQKSLKEALRLWSFKTDQDVSMDVSMGSTMTNGASPSADK